MCESKADAANKRNKVELKAGATTEECDKILAGCGEPWTRPVRHGKPWHCCVYRLNQHNRCDKDIGWREQGRRAAGNGHTKRSPRGRRPFAM